MARAHVDSSDEDDDLPSLAQLMQRARPAPTPSARANTAKLLPKTRNQSQPQSQPESESEPELNPHRMLNCSTLGSKHLVNPRAIRSSSVSLRKQADLVQKRDTAIKRTPQRTAAPHVNYRSKDPSDAEYSIDGASTGPSDNSEDAEQSIWCGDEDDAYSGEDDFNPNSYSDLDLPILKSTHQKFIQPPVKDVFEDNRLLDSPRRRLFAKKDLLDQASDAGLNDIFKKPLVPIYLTKPSPIERPTSSSSVDNDAILKYSPPRSRRRKSPYKVPDASEVNCPLTPPPSKSPTKLKSPSKKIRIPTAPHRESVDTFWAADVVNEWNDRHSPRKRLGLESNKPPDDSRTSSVKTSPVKSPVKKDKAAVMKRKMFEEGKKKMAEEFLQELDQTIARGEISEMTSGTGGVEIKWTKTLNTTAGRATWRKDGFKRHHASIELAAKVVDNEERLYNTLAHEFCHLLTYMKSDMRDNPHGKEFQGWAAKVSREFAHRNVQVTTKHSYEIDYKYVWTCTRCLYGEGRHSKSLDPAKDRCKYCVGEIVQTKPVPRQGQPSEYQLFMKNNINRIKRENAGKSLGAIMRLVGQEYRDMKAKKGLSEVGKHVEDLAEALRFVELDA